MVCQVFHTHNISSGLLSRVFLLLTFHYLGCFSTCVEGRWACKNLQTPATCAVEEGSHVTTFDGKAYNFHGDCYYTLAKVESKVSELCTVK